ncbi:MAG: hypothetical protein MUC92_12955 [Fimbriimonadaceae bacterium]|jgi:hypothetical protein|nr:hypothetical protein [Fimbriimonadaceae bacterium]
MMRFLAYSCLAVITSLVLTGCLMSPGTGFGGSKEVEYEADPSPATFSGDVATFLTGKWVMGTNLSPDLPGISGELKEQVSELDTDQVWEFLADGTLKVKVKALPNEVGGSWQVQGEKLVLNYTTYGGKPMEEAKRALQANAETGRSGDIANEIHADFLFQTLPKFTQLAIGDDKKTLKFLGSAANIPGMEAMTPEEQVLAGKLVVETLVRVREKK